MPYVYITGLCSEKECLAQQYLHDLNITHCFKELIKGGEKRRGEEGRGKRDGGRGRRRKGKEEGGERKGNEERKKEGGG